MKTIDEFRVVEDDNLQEEHHDENSATNIGALEVLKSILKQHSWSISDPGLPSSLRPRHPPPVYLSVPLLKGGYDAEKQPILTGNFEVEERHNHDPGEMKKTIIKKICSKTPRMNKDFLKWVFILLNVLFEVCQIVLAQEKNQRKIRRQTYLKLSIITSSFCLIIAVIEAFHEGRRFRVVWQRRGNCCWFYYPGNQGRVFGRVSLYFAIISSLIQLIINIIAIFARKDSVEFDYMPLLLAVCYLVAAIIGSREKSSSISIRCNVHGLVDAESTFHEGQESIAFHCPQCQIENYYEELNFS